MKRVLITVLILTSCTVCTAFAAEKKGSNEVNVALSKWGATLQKRSGNQDILNQSQSIDGGSNA